MTKLAVAEKTILFMNNMAGDDLWEYGHLMLPGYARSSTPQELFKYKNGRKETYDSNGLYMTSIPTEGAQLYGFPFLPIDVDPFDIEYPMPVSGVVVTQDMRMLDYFVDQDPNFHHIARLQTSRLAWAKNQGLPSVLAVHHANGHKGKIKDLNRLVGMEVFCPVIWHDGKPNVKFFDKAIRALLEFC